MATSAITHEEYVRRIKDRGIPTEPIGVYTAGSNPITHKCLVCGDIGLVPPQYYLGKKNPRGCPKCVSRGRYKDAPEKHLSRLRAAHGDNVTYAGGYVDSVTKCNYHCQIGHEFTVEPYSILRLSGCPVCSIEERARRAGNTSIENSARSYQQELDKLTPRYVALERYKGAQIKIKHECPHGHVFHATPSSLLSEGRKCPQCIANPKYYNRDAIKWMEWECHQRGIDFSEIVHAENHGEYVLCLPSGSNFRFDGFHLPTRTVFEYYDDKHHGNPIKYHNETGRVAFKKTIERENVLKSMGYDVITIWASEWKVIQEDMGDMPMDKETISA